MGVDARRLRTRAGLAASAFDWHCLDGVILQRLAHEEAARRFKAAIAASPRYLPARVKLAEALCFEAGDHAGSRSVFEALAREPAAEPMGRFGLGGCQVPARVSAGTLQCRAHADCAWTE